MNWLRLHRAESRLQRVPRRVWHLASTVLAVTSALLFLAVPLANFQRSYVVTLLSVAFAAAIFALIFLLVGFSRQLRREQRETASVLQTTAGELQQMADNIQEIFWTSDAKSQNAILCQPRLRDHHGTVASLAPGRSIFL